MSDPVEESIALVATHKNCSATSVHASDIEMCARAMWARPLVTALVAAREEIGTDDKLLADRQSILDAAPCPAHGPCVPHVLMVIGAAYDLRPYVRHSEGCSAGIDARYKCKCGLSELMAKEESNGE